MEKESLKFVIVGHVDHGKSTLIGRLLFDTNSLQEGKMEEIRRISKDLGKKMEFSFLLDHLREEREQGITIDTAQTFFRTDKKEYTIIDAPGHVEFLRNMITGSSQAEAAILIVDVVEGIMEQTKRHANILSLLGVEKVIVAFNKMDSVSYKKEVFEKIKTELEDFLGKIKIKPEFCIPISAYDGDNVAVKSKNMDWYKAQQFWRRWTCSPTRFCKKAIRLFFLFKTFTK
jgi:small GTP-binding protein